MMCGAVQMKLPGFLDGTLPSSEHGILRRHMDKCSKCRRELQRYAQLQSVMSRVEPVVPPADLPVRIRAAAAQARDTKPWPRRAWDRITLVTENLLEPVAVPATGGLMAALMVFAVVLQHLLVGVPLGAVPNDRPTNLVQPARLESLAWFNLSDADTDQYAGYNVLLVEAMVNENGEVVAYEILSGPQSTAVRRKLDQVMLFSKFRPQMSFGRPVPGGRVVLNLTEIRVRG